MRAREDYVRRAARDCRSGMAVLFGCLSLGILFAHDAAAASCASGELGRPLLFDQIVTIADSREQRLQVSLAAPGRYLIAAQEWGIDALVSLSMPQRAALRFDSPMQRSGTQIALVTLQQPAAMDVLITAKERAAAGRVQVTAHAISDECAKPLQLIAEAHRHYALAEMVYRAVDLTATSDVTGTYRHASELLRSALSAMSKGPSQLRAVTTYELAMALYEGVWQWSRSEADAQQAVVEFESVGDEYGVALAQALQGAALMEAARSGGTAKGNNTIRPKLADAMAHARRLLADAAATHAKRGEVYEQALARNNIGLSYYYEGLPKEALVAYEQALAHQEKLGERGRTAQVLQNMALVRLDHGQFSRALTDYERAVELLDYVGPQLRGSILNNSALANAVTGHFDVALDRYTAALDLWIKVQNIREEARSRNGLGYVYYLVGDYEQALEFYEQALSQRTAEVDGPGRASTLRVLGNLHRMFGRTQLALDMHQEAFKLASTAIAQDTALIQIARDFAAQGDHPRALGVLDDLLGEGSTQDQLTLAHAKLERGRSRAALSERAGAEEDLRGALTIFRQSNLAAEQIECLIELARSSANRSTAVALLDEALDISDGLRAQTSNPELKATLTQPARAAVDFKVALLAESNQDMDAAALESLAATERARARVLAEIGASGRASLASDGAQDIAQRREELYRALSEGRYQYQRLASRYGNTDAGAVAVLAQVSAAQAELDRLNRMQPVQHDPAGIHRLTERRNWLGEDSCIAAYWLGEKDAYAWTMTRTAIHWQKLGDSASVDKQARALQAAFSDFRSVPTKERVRHATTLYDRLIRPLDADCLSKRALYFVPDGPLHYVPFGALRSDAGYLIEAHDVAIVPALSLLNEPPMSHRPHRMLLVSDPVFDRTDPRLAKTGDPAAATVASLDSGTPRLRSSGDLSRLPGTAIEADEIASLWSRGDITRLAGFAATRSALLSAPTASFTHIHLATHRQFDVNAPRLSPLLLSTYDASGSAIEGRVWAGDIAALRFDAELVVLSGCETALGRYVHGEGLMGLQYLVLGRGARSVIASTWSVPDREAAALMTRFYGRLLTHAQSPSQALAQSMREMLRRDRSVDPAYWSAFSVMTTTLSTEE